MPGRSIGPGPLRAATPVTSRSASVTTGFIASGRATAARTIVASIWASRSRESYTSTVWAYCAMRVSRSASACNVSAVVLALPHCSAICAGLCGIGTRARAATQPPCARAASISSAPQSVTVHPASAAASRSAANAPAAKGLARSYSTHTVAPAGTPAASRSSAASSAGVPRAAANPESSATTSNAREPGIASIEVVLAYAAAHGPAPRSTMSPTGARRRNAARAAASVSTPAGRSSRLHTVPSCVVATVPSRRSSWWIGASLAAVGATCTTSRRAPTSATASAPAGTRSTRATCAAAPPR